MKRSEMINKMLQASKTLYGEKTTGEDFETFELKLINLMLETVENAGMLPPIESFRTVHDLDLGLPEWEPE